MSFSIQEFSFSYASIPILIKYEQKRSENSNFFSLNIWNLVKSIYSLIDLFSLSFQPLQFVTVG